MPSAKQLIKELANKNSIIVESNTDIINNDIEEEIIYYDYDAGGALIDESADIFEFDCGGALKC